MVIAIDGPAASGKSTTAKEVASRLEYIYLDTGATYRALTLKAIENSVDMENGNELSRLALKTDISFKNARLYLNGKDVTEEIRKPVVDENVSLVSSYPEVRKRMVILQRKISKGRNVVCEGRDIGTVVFPDADVKIYIDASLDVRAKRRMLELQSNGVNITYENVKRQLQARDNLDSKRQHSPLSIPEGAVILDTTNLTIEEQVKKVLEIIESLKRV